MTNVSRAAFEKNADVYLNMALDGGDAINIVTQDGNAVLLSETAYRSLIETLKLLSVPGMKERLTEGLKTTVKECDDFEW